MTLRVACSQLRANRSRQRVTTPPGIVMASERLEIEMPST
jgi:hypothetical protein